MVLDFFGYVKNNQRASPADSAELIPSRMPHVAWLEFDRELDDKP